MRRMLAWMVIAASLAGPARAASVDGVSLPDTYPVPGQTLVLNGMGVRTVTVLSVRAYVVGLYLPQRSSDPAAILASTGPKVVLMQFLHSATKAQVEKQYREGEERNCGHGECAPADEPDFERLIAATPAAKVGDTLTFFYTARGVRVLFNTQQIADFANPDLALRLLAGWIGDKPGVPELRARLLGR